MDIKSLEALGITAEDLTERIVNQAVQSLLSSTGYNEDGDEVVYEARFKREVEKRLQEAVDAKISALAAVHVVPRVGELIERTNMRKTNQYGEPKGDSMTFIEYIASRAEAYMSEDVDCNGKSKAEANDSYNWRASGPRLTVLMRMYIRDTLEAHAKKAVSDVNTVIAKNIAKAAQDAITSAASALKVSVSA
jgi:hypothetical protein